MSTIFLRFPDEAAFMSTLPGFEQQSETGSPLPEGVAAISIIGEIYEGDPPLPIAGWHVNALGTLPDAWTPYVVSPANPVRVFGSAPGS